MIRQATKDTTLSIPGPTDLDAAEILIPKGTYVSPFTLITKPKLMTSKVNIDMVGIRKER